MNPRQRRPVNCTWRGRRGNSGSALAPDSLMLAILKPLLDAVIGLRRLNDLPSEALHRGAFSFGPCAEAAQSVYSSAKSIMLIRRFARRSPIDSAVGSNPTRRCTDSRTLDQIAVLTDLHTC